MSKTRTITLTGRPPVTIDEAKWTCVAEAIDYWRDSQYDSQANRKSDWWVRVRRHADGRAIVYAGYRYSSQWACERDYDAKRGILLAAGSSSDGICKAIVAVCSDIAGAEHYGNDAERWPTLAADCIADMPAEVLD